MLRSPGDGRDGILHGDRSWKLGRAPVVHGENRNTRFDGFGVAEAGALLGLKPATARTRYARAKFQLKRHLS
jgi:hypothetical protein